LRKAKGTPPPVAVGAARKAKEKSVKVGGAIYSFTLERTATPHLNTSSKNKPTQNKRAPTRTQTTKHILMVCKPVRKQTQHTTNQTIHHNAPNRNRSKQHRPKHNTTHANKKVTGQNKTEGTEQKEPNKTKQTEREKTKQTRTNSMKQNKTAANDRHQKTHKIAQQHKQRKTT
jgi:hypothetical protein